MKSRWHELLMILDKVLELIDLALEEETPPSFEPKAAQFLAGLSPAEKVSEIRNVMAGWLLDGPDSLARSRFSLIEGLS
jgi:hypothetical protein